MAVLKTITNYACPALPYLYAAVKSANDFTTLDAAQVAELNGLIGGATVADLTAMSSEVFASISTTGIKNLPAATVNSLPASHLSSATTTQLAALLSSPYYSSFSDSVKSQLATLSGISSTGSTGSSDSNVVESSTLILSSIATLIVAFNRQF